MLHSTTPWWRTDDYAKDLPIPAEFHHLAGPQGVALVRAYPDGRTSAGWGLHPGKDSPPDQRFMPMYTRGEFDFRRAIYGYNQDRWAFAFVMRSLRLVCVDIDGKNGGLEHAKRLGMLPPTLSETSKSGNGYHLFYEVADEWDLARGYGLIPDRIGIEQGVDIRGTGCVYHHKPQRWNQRKIAPLPAHLQELMLHREQKQAAQSERIVKVLANNDSTEVLMLHDEIVSQLKKPIAPGKRNQTLFAIGNQMREAQVPGWEDLLIERGLQVGLPGDECDKLVANIERYGLTLVAP